MEIDSLNEGRLVALLIEASSAIDDMWRAAVSEHTIAALYLAEASQAVHRALIALRQSESEVLTPLCFGRWSL